MGNILGSNSNLSPIGTTGPDSNISSFYNKNPNSNNNFFKRRINTILLNRKDVINGRITYVNLIKYSCRIAKDKRDANFDLYNTLYSYDNSSSTISTNSNTQIISIRLIGIKNFLPYITVKAAGDTTDSLIYIFDNFNLPISVPADYTWPIDFPKENTGSIKKYDYDTYCKVDMPEICAKQYYDNNSITVDSNNNFIWNYNVSRAFIPTDNINNLRVSLSGIYALDNIYISTTTRTNFDYLGRFMRYQDKNQIYTINPDIVDNTNWNTTGKYYTYIIFPEYNDINLTHYKPSDFLDIVKKYTDTNNYINLYYEILRCIIINNFILQGNAYRLLTSHDKILNYGENMCACLNSALGYNLNISPSQSNKFNQIYFQKKTPFMNSNGVLY